MKAEFVYLAHDNSINLILKADGVAISLSSVTGMKLVIGAVMIASTNQSNDPILWAQVGYATGEVRLFLGAETLTPGNYQAVLIVVDATNPDGIVWGPVPFTVVADMEPATP